MLNRLKLMTLPSGEGIGTRRFCPPLRKALDAVPLRGFFFSLYNRGGFCYNVEDYDMIKGDAHEIFDRSDL